MPKGKNPFAKGGAMHKMPGGKMMKDADMKMEGKEAKAMMAKKKAKKKY